MFLQVAKAVWRKTILRLIEGLAPAVILAALVRAKAWITIIDKAGE